LTTYFAPYVQSVVTVGPDQ